MTEKAIWDYLVDKLGNEYGAAGLMGNLYAESGLISNNLQNSYQKKLGFTDATYTKAVDDGSYTNFIKDSAGYGFAQWTYWSRKRNLLNYAKARKKSIGDPEMQLGFLMEELGTSFLGVRVVLRTAESVREASDAVLLKFERPADMSEKNQIRRAAICQGYYDKYAEGEEMTQEQFNKMMDAWLEERANAQPSKWSEQDRKWAESNGIVQGTGKVMGYRSFTTKEEVAAMIHRAVK